MSSCCSEVSSLPGKVESPGVSYHEWPYQTEYTNVNGDSRWGGVPPSACPQRMILFVMLIDIVCDVIINSLIMYKSLVLSEVTVLWVLSFMLISAPLVFLVSLINAISFYCKCSLGMLWRPCGWGQLRWQTVSRPATMLLPLRVVTWPAMTRCRQSNDLIILLDITKATLPTWGKVHKLSEFVYVPS